MSALITVEQLNEYSGNYEDVSYKATIIGAASAVIERYLRYLPQEAARVYQFVSWGTSEVLLPVPHVTNIDKVIVGGIQLASDAYSIVDCNGLHSILYMIDKVPRGVTVVIEYTAGWKTLPEEIELAALRIASLMLEEANGNIGVTQKSFADMSKTFVNYANYDKYLKPLAPYRAGVV